MTQGMETQQSVGQQGAARRHLQLVGGTRAPVAPSLVEVTHRLVLRSWMAVPKAEIRPSAWRDLLDHLWPGEEVHVVHTIMRERERPVGYSLRLDVLQSLSARASQTQQAAAEALKSMFPSLVFESVPHTGGVEAMLPVRACIEPMPVQLGEPLETRSAGRPHWGPVTENVPFPGELPNWMLTTPFDEPLAEALQIQIRIRAMELGTDAQHRFSQILQRLRRGGLRVFHPSSPLGPDSHDPELGKGLDALLQTWLRQPLPGYAINVLVRSRSDLSGFALQRIGRDILGRYPYRITLVEDDAAWDSRTTPTLLKSTQGLGGLFAPDDRMARFGLPEQVPAPAKLPDGTGSVVGHAGHEAAVALPDSMRLSHVAVVGGSGTGKSNFLLRTLQQDIARGLGVGLIDVHGDLFDATLAMIPPERASDVVIVDAEDPAFSVALNPLEGTRGNALLQNFVANQVLDIIERLFETPESTGPMMRNHVRHALLLAMCHPGGGTIADAARVFEDAEFRAWLLAKADQRLADYFKTFAATNGENGFKNWLPYLIARFNPFIQNPVLLRMLSRPSTVNLPRLINEGRIVLFRLSKAVLQDLECQLLGTLLLMQFHVAALSRASIRPELRRPFHLVVDEFHTFANDSTPALFREARKFGLGLTVATQSFSSLRHRRGGDLTNALLANTATKVLFRLSPLDAKLVEEYAEPTFNVADLTRTQNYQAVVCMTASDVPPFRMHAALPDTFSSGLAVQDLRERSGTQFATALSDANDFISKRHGVSIDALRQATLWAADEADPGVTL